MNSSTKTRRAAAKILAQTSKLTGEEIKSFYQQLRLEEPIKPEMERIRYIKAINSEAWNWLQEQAADGVQRRNSDLLRLGEMQARLTALEQPLAHLPRVIRDIPAFTVKPDISKLRKSFYERMRPGSDAKNEKNTPVKAVEVNPKNIAANLCRAVETAHAAVVGKQKECFASLMGARLAQTVSALNLTPPAKEKLIPKEIRNWLRITFRTLNEHEKELWNALRHEDLFEAILQALQIQMMAKELSLNAAQFAAVIARERKDAKKVSVSLSQLAVETGDVLRAIHRAEALGLLIASLARLPKENPAISEWVTMAKKLPFGVSEQKKNANTSKQVDAALRKTGSIVTVSGTITEVSITHRKGKAISVAKLVEPGGDTILLLLEYIKIDSGGLVPGAAAVVTGVWTEKLPAPANESGLVVDRIGYEALGRTNWKDWVTNAIHEIYTPVPHGLAAHWSWQPGRNGAGNPLRYGTWYLKKRR